MIWLANARRDLARYQQLAKTNLVSRQELDAQQALVSETEGTIKADEASVASAQLQLDWSRYQQLAKTNLVSRQELDAQQALVSETEGTIKADEASVASAQLQLDWSRITAPVDGRVGLKQVDVGNQISSGDTTGIVVITQTHPIDLVFTLPESDIATVVQAQKAGKPLVVEAWDRTNSKKLSEGTLLSLDNQIDATTGTIKVKARFNNQDDALFPNQFVNARMLVDTEQNAVVIPTAALQMGLKQVDVGNQISSGDTTGIVVITQTHPIDLVFTLPESDIATVVQAQKAGKPLVVEAWDRTNSKKLSEGTLLSLDNQIDATTGTIKVKARFNNQDDALFPNQFVNARMLVDTEQNAVVIPTAALQMGNEGHFVWVLNSENKVSKHLVTPGIQDSQKVVIRAGISAGDRVVTDGIDRLTEGAKVEVVEAQSATTPEEKATSREYAKKGARS